MRSNFITGGGGGIEQGGAGGRHGRIRTGCKVTDIFAESSSAGGSYPSSFGEKVT